MTQKEAIIKAIKMLGGRASLQDIYPLAIEIGDFSGSQKPDATIRNCLLTSPKQFRHSPGKPDGWWELISFQEEIASRDKRIVELKAQLADKDKEISELRQMETADGFVRRLLSVTKCLYKRDEKELDVIRKLLFTLGRRDAEAELDAWIEGRECRPAINVSGDLVMNKHVENEVSNVESDGTGININKGKEQKI